MAFDFNSSGSSFDDFGSEPSTRTPPSSKKTSAKKGGFNFPRKETNSRPRPSGGFDDSGFSAPLDAGGLDVPKRNEKTPRTGSADLTEIPWKVIIYAVMALVAIILLVVFWEEIVEMVTGILTVAIIVVVLLVVLRMLFPRRR